MGVVRKLIANILLTKRLFLHLQNETQTRARLLTQSVQVNDYLYFKKGDLSWLLEVRKTKL